jgi:hypothetical protein
MLTPAPRAASKIDVADGSHGSDRRSERTHQEQDQAPNRTRLYRWALGWCRCRYGVGTALHRVVYRMENPLQSRSSSQASRPDPKAAKPSRDRHHHRG